MGRSSHDNDAYTAAHSAAAASGAAFDWSSKAITSGTCHPALNPGYGGYRYSYDLPDMLTESVSVIFDVTGSNRTVAKKVWAEMPALYDLIYGQSWLKGKNFNMQIGATGDAWWDEIPMQLSQFERNGITIDQWLQSLVLEGGGGGGGQESYELMWYLLTHQNKLDCWKRGGKGILVMIFDEAPYNYVSADQVKALYNVPKLKDSDLEDVDVEMGPRMRSLTKAEPGWTMPEKDIPLNDIVADLKSKYDVFAVICGGTSYYDSESTLPLWRSLFGEQNVIKLPDPSTITSLISALVGMLRGGISKKRIIKELGMLPGSTPKDIEAIGAALTLVSGSEADSSSTNIVPSSNGGNKITRL